MKESLGKNFENNDAPRSPKELEFEHLPLNNEMVYADPNTLDADLKKGLHEALDSLPPRQKKILELIYFEGKNYTEAAKDLKCTQGEAIKLAKEAFQKIRHPKRIRMMNPGGEM